MMIIGRKFDLNAELRKTLYSKISTVAAESQAVLLNFLYGASCSVISVSLVRLIDACCAVLVFSCFMDEKFR
jgi:hypothetical protein